MGNRKRDVYPTRFFVASDFPETPMVLEIETARTEKFENDGKSTEKLVAYFANGRGYNPRFLPLKNRTAAPRNVHFQLCGLADRPDAKRQGLAAVNLKRPPRVASAVDELAA
jgi:hypothetical protein